MRVAITFVLFAGVSLAAPQFEGIKNLFSCTEKVPYTTLKQFDVSSVFYFFYLMIQLHIMIVDLFRDMR